MYDPSLSIFHEKGGYLTHTHTHTQQKTRAKERRDFQNKELIIKLVLQSHQ